MRSVELRPVAAGLPNLPVEILVSLRPDHPDPFAPFLHLTLHFGLNSALKFIFFCRQLALTSGVLHIDRLQHVFTVIRCLALVSQINYTLTNYAN